MLRKFSLIVIAITIVGFASQSRAFVSFGDTAYLHPDGAANSRIDFAPHLEADGAGNWVAVSTGPYVSVSSDDGVTWSLPELVAPGNGIPGFWDFEPMVKTDGAGTWLLVWAGDSDDLNGPDDPEIYLSRSTDNGATWSAGVEIASNAATDDGFDGRPRIDTDGAGNWMIVWHTQDPVNGDDDLMFTVSTDGGVTWSAVAWLDPLAAFDARDERNPALATDGAGNWLVVVNSAPQIGTGQLRAFRSNDLGATWLGPVQINTTLGLAVPDLAAGGPGYFMSAHTNQNLNIGRTSDGGATWSATPISGIFSAAQSRARIATDGIGGWVATWSSHDDPDGSLGIDADVLIARSADDGERWSSPSILNSNATSDLNDDDGAMVATDGAGNWIAAWRATGEEEIFFSRSPALCPFVRRGDCKVPIQPGKAKMVVGNSLDDSKDKMKLKISKTNATAIGDFGDPTTGSDLVFCAWDASSEVDRLVWQIAIAGGSSCNGAPCWSASPKGYKYSDKLREAGAFNKAKLVAGDDGKASVAVGGKGLRLATAPTPFDNDSSLAAQVIAIDTNVCWGATFSAPKKNDFRKYVAKSD